MALVELRSLSKTFGTVKAADDVSLDIESGEFITLLGPSGSGRTTVLRMIAGFEVPDSGSIHLSGVDTLPLWILKEVGRPNQASVVNVVATVVILLSLIPVYISQHLARAQEEER